MLTRLGLVLALLLSGCVYDDSVPLPFMQQAPAAAPTPSDWNAALKGVVLNTGGADCLQIRRANVDDCSKEKRFNLYCIDENDPTSFFSDTTPKGCGVLYMKTLDTCGDQIAAGLQLKCRLDTEVPQATPSPAPTQTPVDTNQYCVNHDPGWCWHPSSRLSGNDCWASCLCVRRSVGPCAGVSTPKPTVKPTATPTVTVTPLPTGTFGDPNAPCRANDPQYCWDKDSIVNAFGECFSSCTCLRKPNANCRTTPTQTPRPTQTPGLTARPTSTPPAATSSPAIQCPAGQHAVWWCEPDATLTPAPVLTPRPTTSSGQRVIAGGWFIPECMAVDLFGERSRWYDFPYVFAAYPKGFNKHVTDFKEPCTPNAEVWNATVAIPNYWANTDAANIEIAKPQMAATIAAVRERKQQIADLRAQGVPEAKLPKMPILWIAETSTGAYGYSQDLWQGGFYKTVNGKRTLKSGAEMSSPLPKYIEFMIAEYQKEGVTEFADAPYTFFWANREFNQNLSASRTRRSDARDRELVVPMGRPDVLRAYTAAQKRAIVEGNHPEIWPKGYNWQSNDAINVSAEGHAGLDVPDTAALKRDATYYTYYVLAMRAKHPEVTRIIPQLSNCVYNRPADSPYWAIAAQMIGVNRAFGIQPDIQIEGCDGRANELAGKPWNTPLADCVALKAIQKAPNPIISMWLADIRKGLALDYSGCK